MALMQQFPKFVASDECFKEPTVVPRTRVPLKVEFRSGADLSGVVSAIAGARQVALDAAPGAGKSTVFPLKLAASTGELVVQVEPFDRLAQSLARYVGKHGGLSAPVEWIKTVDQPWPDKGVAIVSAAVVVAKWLHAGKVVMPRCYVLHDESHESGAATAAVRVLAGVSSDVLSYVSMTATSGPTGARRMETDGKLELREYAPESFADPWTVEEVGAPWACELLGGNILLFEDDASRATALVQAYNMNGVRAFRLHSKMSEVEYAAFEDDVFNPANHRLHAFVADSSFRSGFTMPVSVIIDSGKIRRVAVRDGRPVHHERSIYECEAVQTQSRGARMKGQATVYYRPVGELQRKMCDLEQVDVEALALICRALGFLPPTYARGAKMASGDVPRDVCAALRGAMPISLLPDTVLVPVSEYSERRGSVQSASEPRVGLRTTHVEQYSAPATQALSASAAAPVPGLALGLGVHPAVSDARGDEGFSPVNAVDTLRAMVSSLDSRPRAEYGKYLHAQGSTTSAVSCFAFPDGVDSVRRALEADLSATLHFAWSPLVRSVAINSLLNSYNLDLLEMTAYSSVLTGVKNLDGYQRTALRSWAVGATERMTTLGARAERSYILACRLAEGFCDVEPCGNLFQDEERAMVDIVRGDFSRSVEFDVVDVRPSELARARQWTKQVAAPSVERPTHYLGMSPRMEVQREVPPAARNYSGHHVPGFFRWMVGGSIDGGSSLSSSSNSSIRPHRRGAG